MSRAIDMTGQRVGRLLVVSRAPGDPRYAARWRCHCDCGTVKVIAGTELRRGDAQSCGCLQKEVQRARLTTHGRSRTPLYKTWRGIIDRCTMPTDPRYKNYGARGITVCKRWLQFDNFLRDMGEKPTPAHTIERKNNNRGYSMSNCEWATRTAQARNMRSNVNIRSEGVTRCLTDWLRINGIKPGTYYTRISRGWSVRKAAFTPPKGKVVRISSVRL